jgi:NADPH-dependent 2,4-dienoyl-CoA reductase/sulfur reductase-like enzyme/nitrite reductase/ring-hydroxylating ferredoxin subunit
LALCTTNQARPHLSASVSVATAKRFAAPLIEPDSMSDPVPKDQEVVAADNQQMHVKLDGPDFTQGIKLSTIPDGAMLLGHARAEPVLLVRRGDKLFAIGAVCTHYGAPLADGLLVGDTIRCPWHHACFSLHTGEALRAPALNPVSRWRVEQGRDRTRQFTPVEQPTGTVYVREKLESVTRSAHPLPEGIPGSIVIVGGGAAGNAAAETLRHEGYCGRITMLSADESIPCDRPNLSKGYLAGTASEESNLLRSAKFYTDHTIDLRLGARVAAIDIGHGQVELSDGSRHDYGALLLATGADPVRLAVPGADLPRVHYLRTLADSRALVAKTLTSKRVVVIGASFIGLEVAASLRARNIEVHVVGPEAVPMEKILGPEVGNFIRALHEEHGVRFHLGTTATSIDARSVTLKNGENLTADLVVVGIGVRPATSLAAQAGLAIDRGVTVDDYLETSVTGIFAAGDIARWPDRLTGERIRVEHFVVAERQGQTAARNILGQRKIFSAVPFFWTEQYDLGIAYIGHAEKWDSAQIDGQLDAKTRNCAITYRRDGKKLAVAVIHRDLQGLRAEVDFERANATPEKHRIVGGPPDLQSALG